jgi:hypothetical protein
MNEPLSTACKQGLSSPQTESLPHYCQRWARQVVQSLYAAQFDAHWRENAIQTGFALANAGLSVPLTQGSTVADLLYKLRGSGGAGHVGIRIDGNRVAENSSVHWDGHDARGIRTMKEFGHFDLIIRLPLPTAQQIAVWTIKTNKERARLAERADV